MDQSPSRRESARVHPVLFAYGFRPFFLLGGLYAIASMVPWVLWLAGVDAFGFVAEAPGWWHAHEMLFGFTTPIIAGFLLTAVPTWTKTEPVRGWPLAFLCILWLIGRAAMWSGAEGPIPAALDIAFLPALAIAVAVPLVRARANRNLFVVLVLLILTAANLLMHLERLGYDLGQSGLGALIATDLIVLLMVIVGGRITAAFTVAALKRRGRAVEIPTGRAVDKAAIIATVFLVFADLLLGGKVAAVVALIAAIANGARMVGWKTGDTFRSPILWVLHLGYAWIVAGLALRGLSGFTELLQSVDAGHGLTLGAIGTMTLGVMSRVVLGHTGRALEVAPTIAVAYGLLSLAALTRIFGPAFLESETSLLMGLSGGLWMLAWLLFSWVYAPMLLGRRVDGKPG